jgi:hypothetical protein
MVFRFGEVDVILDQAALRTLLDSEQGPVARHLLRIGGQVEAEAKRLLSNQLVNVQTGRLRSSTTHVLVRTGRGLSVFVGSGADYGIYVHEGTRYLAGRPYLVIAVERVTGRRIA